MRTFTRVLAPSLANASKQAIRPSLRCAVALPSSMWSPMTSRSICTTLPRLGDGSTDTTLSSKLQAEIDYESENDPYAQENQPEFISALQDSKVWELQENPGKDEIYLVRSFGNEKIRVSLSTQDLHQESPPVDDVEGDKKEADEEEDFEDGEPPYVEAEITISKAGKGGLTINTMVQDGIFLVDSVVYHNNEKTVSDIDSAQADLDRQLAYNGPPFGQLDDALQEEIDAFLEERGINSDLSVMLLDILAWKEQREYVNWLKNLKSFVDA